VGDRRRAIEYLAPTGGVVEIRALADGATVSLHNPIKDIHRCKDPLHLRGDEWIRELGEG